MSGPASLVSSEDSIQWRMGQHPYTVTVFFASSAGNRRIVPTPSGCEFLAQLRRCHGARGSLGGRLRLEQSSQLLPLGDAVEPVGSNEWS